MSPPPAPGQQSLRGTNGIANNGTSIYPPPNAALQAPQATFNPYSVVGQQQQQLQHAASNSSFGSGKAPRPLSFAAQGGQQPTLQQQPQQQQQPSGGESWSDSSWRSIFDAALVKAQQAVQLDELQEFTLAAHLYSQAASDLGRVIPMCGSDKKKQSMLAIQAIYLDRVNQLKETVLPKRSMSSDDNPQLAAGNFSNSNSNPRFLQRSPSVSVYSSRASQDEIYRPSELHHYGNHHHRSSTSATSASKGKGRSMTQPSQFKDDYGYPSFASATAVHQQGKQGAVSPIFMSHPPSNAAVAAAAAAEAEANGTGQVKSTKWRPFGKKKNKEASEGSTSSAKKALYEDPFIADLPPAMQQALFESGVTKIPPPPSVAAIVATTPTTTGSISNQNQQLNMPFAAALNPGLTTAAGSGTVATPLPMAPAPVAIVDPSDRVEYSSNHKANWQATLAANQQIHQAHNNQNIRLATSRDNLQASILASPNGAAITNTTTSTPTAGATAASLGLGGPIMPHQEYDPNENPDPRLMTAADRARTFEGFNTRSQDRLVAPNGMLLASPGLGPLRSNTTASNNSNAARFQQTNIAPLTVKKASYQQVDNFGIAIGLPQQQLIHKPLTQSSRIEQIAALQAKQLQLQQLQLQQQQLQLQMQQAGQEIYHNDYPIHVYGEEESPQMTPDFPLYTEGFVIEEEDQYQTAYQQYNEANRANSVNNFNLNNHHNNNNNINNNTNDQQRFLDPAFIGMETPANGSIYEEGINGGGSSMNNDNDNNNMTNNNSSTDVNSTHNSSHKEEKSKFKWFGGKKNKKDKDLADVDREKLEKAEKERMRDVSKMMDEAMFGFAGAPKKKKKDKKDGKDTAKETSKDEAKENGHSTIENSGDQEFSGYSEMDAAILRNMPPEQRQQFLLEQQQIHMQLQHEHQMQLQFQQFQQQQQQKLENGHAMEDDDGGQAAQYYFQDNDSGILQSPTSPYREQEFSASKFLEPAYLEPGYVDPDTLVQQKQQLQQLQSGEEGGAVVYEEMGHEPEQVEDQVVPSTGQKTESYDRRQYELQQVDPNTKEDSDFDENFEEKKRKVPVVVEAQDSEIAEAVEEDDVQMLDISSPQPAAAPLAIDTTPRPSFSVPERNESLSPLQKLALSPIQYQPKTQYVSSITSASSSIKQKNAAPSIAESTKTANTVTIQETGEGDGTMEVLVDEPAPVASDAGVIASTEGSIAEEVMSSTEVLPVPVPASIKQSKSRKFSLFSSKSKKEKKAAEAAAAAAAMPVPPTPSTVKSFATSDSDSRSFHTMHSDTVAAGSSSQIASGRRSSVQSADRQFLKDKELKEKEAFKKMPTPKKAAKQDDYVPYEYQEEVEGPLMERVEVPENREVLGFVMPVDFNYDDKAEADTAALDQWDSWVMQLESFEKVLVENKGMKKTSKSKKASKSSSANNLAANQVYADNNSSYRNSMFSVASSTMTGPAATRTSLDLASGRISMYSAYSDENSNLSPNTTGRISFQSTRSSSLGALADSPQPKKKWWSSKKKIRASSYMTSAEIEQEKYLMSLLASHENEEKAAAASAATAAAVVPTTAELKKDSASAAHEILDETPATSAEIGLVSTKTEKALEVDVMAANSNEPEVMQQKQVSVASPTVTTVSAATTLIVSTPIVVVSAEIEEPKTVADEESITVPEPVAATEAAASSSPAPKQPKASKPKLLPISTPLATLLQLDSAEELWQYVQQAKTYATTRMNKGDKRSAAIALKRAQALEARWQEILLEMAESEDEDDELLDESEEDEEGEESDEDGPVSPPTVVAIPMPPTATKVSISAAAASVAVNVVDTTATGKKPVSSLATGTASIAVAADTETKEPEQQAGTESEDKKEEEAEDDQSAEGRLPADAPLAAKLASTNATHLQWYIQQAKTDTVAKARSGSKFAALEGMKAVKCLQQRLVDVEEGLLDQAEEKDGENDDDDDDDDDEDEEDEGEEEEEGAKQDKAVAIPLSEIPEEQDEEVEEESKTEQKQE